MVFKDTIHLYGISVVDTIYYGYVDSATNRLKSSVYGTSRYKHNHNAKENQKVKVYGRNDAST